MRSRVVNLVSGRSSSLLYGVGAERKVIDTHCPIGAARLGARVAAWTSDGECRPLQARVRGLAGCLSDLDRTQLLLVEVSAGHMAVRHERDVSLEWIRTVLASARACRCRAGQALQDEVGRFRPLQDGVTTRRHFEAVLDVRRAGRSVVQREAGGR